MDRDNKELVNKEIEDRGVFRRVFGNREGQSVLTWILNENGYFSLDGKIIEPGRIAFCNLLLNRLGVIQAMNLFEDTAVRVGAANDKDLNTYLQNIRAEEGEE